MKSELEGEWQQGGVVTASVFPREETSHLPNPSKKNTHYFLP